MSDDLEDPQIPYKQSKGSAQSSAELVAVLQSEMALIPHPFADPSNTALEELAQLLAERWKMVPTERKEV